jgi:phage shock protein C
MGHPRNKSWTVMAGVVLVVLGAWLLLERVFAPLIWPLGVVLDVLGRVGWPIALIGIGVLLILRARGAGWNRSGRPLLRSRTDRIVGGVLGGFADYLNVDPTVARVAFVLFTVLTGVWWGVLLYVLAMIVLPEERPYGAPWATWSGWPSSPSSATPPPPAPAVPTSPGASAPPPPPAPDSGFSTGTEPPQAPPVPKSPPSAPQPPQSAE